MKIAAIDIGGTCIKSGLLENGSLSGVREHPTQAEEGGSAVLARVAGIVRTMPGVERVGISTAGEVDAERGTIRLADNIPGYTGLNPKEFLARELGLPTAVENDVNAAAVGEAVYGAGRGVRDFLMVSYGTGVGGAVWLNGGLYRGSCCSAGEFGGLLTHPEDCVPGEVGSGSYERYAGTAALVRRAAALDPALDSGRKIFAAMDRPEVRAVVDAWIDEVAFGLTGLLHCFNPALVVLGGGIMREPYILERLETVLRPKVKASFRDYRLAPAQLGNDAGMYGAGHLAESL